MKIVLNIVPVDSIKWVRPDSIVIGSFQLTGDGKEESYSLHVIRSRDGEITDVIARSLHPLFNNHDEFPIDVFILLLLCRYLLLLIRVCKIIGHLN